MNNRILILVLVLMAAVSVNANANQPVKHEFPALPYAYNALEPYIDAATMEIHYSKHHRAYFDNFLKAIAGTELENLTLEQIFAQISKSPAAVRNMGGGFYNHNLFWENMSPTPGQPSSELLKAIETDFGSMEAFKTAFGKAASTVFGSGWAWLVATPEGKLVITSTPNQDNPLMDIAAVKGTPLLTLDVWEHAYYLKYQNKRADYIGAFWNVVNWNVVNQRYSKLAK
jgi:Fe-Mn family superoxide dismutase